MSYHVYPDPQDRPLSLDAGVKHTPVPIAELFENDLMFIRYVLLGKDCVPPPPDCPAPAVFLTADNEETEITSVDNLNPTPVAGHRAEATVLQPGAGGRAVFQLQVTRFTTDSINWKIRFRNNDTTAHQLTWVVADSDADSRQPWIELPHRQDWRLIDTSAGEKVSQTVQAVNKGTGELVISNPMGPVGAGFELTASPAKIPPNGCGNLTFSFTVPADSGTSTVTFSADSNDENVPLDSTGASHNAQLELVAEVGIPKPEFDPSPKQFDPHEGGPGLTVSLFGRHFDIGRPVVKFGNVAAASVSAPTSTGLTAIVPTGAPGAVPIKVTTDGGTAVSTDLFTVQGSPPQITRFTPSQGRAADPDTSNPGTAVAITGDHFVDGETSVTFKDDPAVVDNITSSEIATSVPAIPSGNYFLTVETPWGKDRSAVPFVVLPKPAFNASPNQFRPTEGPPGTVVTLRGRNFGNRVPQVKFGDMDAATVGDPTPTGVTAVVPSGLPLGGVPITISTDGGTAVSDDLFTVRGFRPQVDGCSPTQGKSQDQKTSTPGTIVTITGNHFEVGSTTVKFDDVLAVIDSMTDTRIVTKVPVLDARTYAISVATQWGPALTTVPFVVLPKPAFNPSPNQFSPTEGAADTTVTLRGQNFNVGSPRVMFGQVAAASVGAPSATGVTTVVPGGLSLGRVQITVDTDGGTTLSSDLFTVRGIPPQIDRFTPPRGRPENPTTHTRGTIVKVIGSHFEVGATTVTFKGPQKETPGTVINMTDSRVRVKAPVVDAGNYVINVSTQWGSMSTKTPFAAIQGNPTYVVVRGDTISGIAAKFGVSLRALKVLNPQIPNINRIEVGQIINIPLTYMVERGDTMSDIAVTFGVTLDALARANPQIRNINLIEIGWIIVIP